MGFASSITIEIEGEEIKDFLSFTIDQKMHDLQEFAVTCRMDTFEELDDSVLNTSKNFIGSTIIIKSETFTLGLESSEPGFIFKGIIYAVKAVKLEADKEDLVELKGYSPDCLLKNHSGCRSFENKSLKDIVVAILKPYYADVLVRKVSPEYTDQIPYCVKYNENNFDFIKRLAARYGEWMYYNGREFIFGSIGGNSCDMVLGQDLKKIDFSVNLNAPGFKYISYDYLNAKSIESESDGNMGKAQLNEVGKIAHDTSWSEMGQIDRQFYPHLNVQPGEESSAQDKLVEIKASGTAMDMCGISGESENMNLVPGTKIKIKELKLVAGGEIDYGEYIITTIKHNCDYLLNYKNTFTAIPAEAKIPAYANPEAVPQSPTQSAIVTDNDDPEMLGRVKVHFFWQEDEQTTGWVRVVNTYSGGERGFFFTPEIDDEVLVGFDAGNAERPYVMGSLYNGSNKPNSTFPDSNNNFKGLVTQSGLRLEFDEGKKMTSIDTPAGNKVVISDDEKSVILSDENGNTVELSTGGIVMNSASDIVISANGKIEIEATGNANISSTGGNVKVDALNIENNATMAFKAKGSLSAEISGIDASLNGDANVTVKGGAMTTIKGGIIMIN